MNRSAVPPPVTRVLDAAEAWLPRRMAAVEARLAELGRRGRRPARGRGGRRRWRRAASACARCWSWSAPAIAPARPRRSAPRPRSSSSTWRPSSTTTCSTRRRCAAAARPWSPAPGARRRPPSATCSSPAPSPSSPRAPRAGRAPGRRCWPAPRSGSRRASWPSAATPSTLSIPAERYLERCRLKTARLFECACLIGAEPGPRRAEALATFGARDRARLPAPRRRPRRHRAAGAHRQGTRHGPARRHRDPAPDPRPRARPELAELDLRTLDAGRRCAGLRADRRHRRPRRGPRRRPGAGRAGEARRSARRPTGRSAASC